eukprot:4115459-Prorocentrum_lima.AAC.1
MGRKTDYGRAGDEWGVKTDSRLSPDAERLDSSLGGAGDEQWVKTDSTLSPDAPRLVAARR